jgi:hypothetical protein
VKPKHRARIRGLAIAAGIVAWSASMAEGHHAVLRFNLEEMTLTADRIFIGRCVAIDETTDSVAQGTLPVTRYTFDVEQVIKGDVPQRFTFTQLGHPQGPPAKTGIAMHGRAVTPAFSLHGMSAYPIGARMMLFLIPNYQNGKLTYPVGLEQGAFEIEGTDGEAVARNNLNNLGLFDAPFNSPALRGGGATVITPDAVDPLAASGLSAGALALPRTRGAVPVGPLVEIVQKIHAAHAKGGK